MATLHLQAVECSPTASSSSGSQAQSNQALDSETARFRRIRCVGLVVRAAGGSVCRSLGWTTRCVLRFFVVRLGVVGERHSYWGGWRKHHISSTRCFDEHTFAHTILEVLSCTIFGCCESWKFFSIVIAFANVAMKCLHCSYVATWAWLRERAKLPPEADQVDSKRVRVRVVEQPYVIVSVDLQSIVTSLSVVLLRHTCSNDFRICIASSAFSSGLAQ